MARPGVKFRCLQKAVTIKFGILIPNGGCEIMKPTSVWIQFTACFLTHHPFKPHNNKMSYCPLSFTPSSHSISDEKLDVLGCRHSLTRSLSWKWESQVWLQFYCFSLTLQCPWVDKSVVFWCWHLSSQNGEANSVAFPILLHYFWCPCLPHFTSKEYQGGREGRAYLLSIYYVPGASVPHGIFVPHGILFSSRPD